MKILKLERPDGDTRTGVFTSGIVSIRGSDKIALFFVLTGRQHRVKKSGGCAEASGKRSECAHADVRCTVEECAEADPPVRGGTSSKLPAHGRRQFVDVAENFPDE